MTVLLVEDDDLLRSVVVDCLNDAAITVASYAAAGEALDRFMGERPEVLITDVNLKSREDGFWLAAVARQRWPELPVVYMSGHGVAEFAGRFGTRDHFLSKPFTGAALMDAVHELTPLN